MSDIAIVTLCAFVLRTAQSAPMYAMQVKQMLVLLKIKGENIWNLLTMIKMKKSLHTMLITIYIFVLNVANLVV